MMKFFSGLVLALLLGLVPAAAQDADTVYTNGKIYTVDETQPWAEAVAIRDGKFVAVGLDEEIAGFVGDKTNIIDMDGGFAMPGIHDTHIHASLVYAHEEAGRLLFEESNPPDKVIEIVKEYATQNPDIKIIRGEKWATADFPGGKATKEWLDPHFPDRAVYLIDETGHNGVANSFLLDLAGITKETPDPEFGVIDRDPDTGEPTGYLSETAMGLIGELIGFNDVEANYRGLERALSQVRAYGTTSIVEMAVGPNSLEAFRQLEEEGKLTVRVDASVAINDYQTEFTTREETLDLLSRAKELDTPLIDINLKIWADGSPLSKTALLIDPYSDDPSTRGEMTAGPSHFEVLHQAHRDGIQVRVHSTGDGTTRAVLDEIEKAQTIAPKPELRHHIGHLMVVHPDDIPRFKQLNVIAEFSPVLWHPTSLGETASEYVGSIRYERWMAIKEFIDADATVTFGSDWPAGTPDADPWRGLEAMITRRDAHTNSGDPLGEGIEIEDAIKAFTINGAMAMMQDDVAGSIEVGKHADMILLDRNLFDAPISEISEVKVLRTVFAGKPVYEAE